MESGQFRQKRVSGLFPQCGAIFMADNATRKECFNRKIFGLPSRFADFVMNVKTGMFLFLFDHQAKKLYGVFEAISDGAMNIAPHAYRSSGMQFPAQVRFSIVWRCVPIPEESFRDAIKENYFATYKFNFGLSEDQVKRLLRLFEMRRTDTRVSRNPLLERKWHIKCNQTNSDVENKPNSESNSESLPEKSACSAISDNGNAIDLDSFEPPPSINTNEMKNPLPDDGLDGEDFIPLPTVELEETEDPLSNGLVESASQEEYDALQLAIDSLFSELGGCPPKENPGSQNDDRREGEKQNENGCDYRVNGLYSDSPKERRSVFLRLSGLSKVIKQERSHSHDKMDSCRDILGRVEKNQEMWKKGSTPFSKPKASKTSVFSRLSYNAGKAPERQPRERMPASKCMSIPEVYPQRKRKNHTMETLCEVKGIIAIKEEKLETNKRICVSKNSPENKTSDHSSTGLVLPLGCADSTVNCGSSDAACKSDDRSNEVQIEESKPENLIGPDKSCPETKLEASQPCPSVSSAVEEIVERAEVSMQRTDMSSKSSMDGSCKKELEFLSLNVAASY